MLFRLLGKLFFYFYILPSIAGGLRFARPFVVKTLAKAIEDIMFEEKNAAKSRQNHPAGSRRS